MKKKLFVAAATAALALPGVASAGLVEDADRISAGLGGVPVVCFDGRDGVHGAASETTVTLFTFDPAWPFGNAWAALISDGRTFYTPRAGVPYPTNGRPWVVCKGQFPRTPPVTVPPVPAPPAPVPPVLAPPVVVERPGTPSKPLCPTDTRFDWGDPECPLPEAVPAAPTPIQSTPKFTG